jgi:hypothetical protein
MPIVTVLRPFNYSPDGTSTEGKVEGDEFDCRDEVIKGLLAEGYIALTLDDGALVIPADWESAPEADRLKLASLLAGKTIKKIAAADAAIRGELERRVSAASQA